MPDQIRGIRQGLGLTQDAFEKLLGVGPKTVVRWEKGTVFQNRSTDSLLRVVAAHPESARFLALLNGVSLPERAIQPLDSGFLERTRPADPDGRSMEVALEEQAEGR